MSSSQSDAAYLRVRDGYTLVAEIESSAGGRLHRADPPERTPQEPRSRFASAMGYALAGERSSVWLSGRELRANLDLLVDAVTQRVPFVIYLELETDHGPAYLAADSGVPVALAGTMQSLLDWSSVMRRAGEDALLPSVVAFERLGTGRSPSDLIWPGQATILTYLGAADQSRPTPAGPKETLLGPTRRPVPSWFDPDRPLSLGVKRDPWTDGAGKAAAQVHLDPMLQSALENARAEWAEVTGRAFSGLRSHEARGRAERTIVTTGPAFERVVEGLGQSADVVAIEQLAPFLSPRLPNDSGDSIVWILDRAPAGLESTSPLPRLLGLQEDGPDEPESRDGRSARSLRRLFQRPVPTSRGAGSRGAGGHPVRYAIWGLGGEPLRANDIALLPGAESGNHPTVYLGQDFVPTGLVGQPHREAYFDGLRRDYPELEQAGLRADRGQHGRRPADPSTPDAGGVMPSGTAPSAEAPERGVSEGAKRRSVRVRFENGGSRPESESLGSLEFLAQLLAAQVREIPPTHAGQPFREFSLWPRESTGVPLTAPATVPATVPQTGDFTEAPDLVVTTNAQGQARVRARGVGTLSAPQKEVADASAGKASEADRAFPDPTQAALLLEGLRRGREDVSQTLGDPEVRARLCQAEHDQELYSRQQWVETVLLRAKEAAIASPPSSDSPGSDSAGSASAGPDSPGSASPGSDSSGSVQLEAATRALISDPAPGLRRIPTDGSLVDPARFRNQIGEIWPQQPPSPEPGVAVPTLPPWTGSLWNARGREAQPWPEFTAEACTVCADCWSTCPEGAIEVRWVDGVSLVRRWTERAQEAGLDPGPLRRAGRGLAATMNAPVDPLNVGSQANVAADSTSNSAANSTTDSEGAGSGRSDSDGTDLKATASKETDALQVVSQALTTWAEKSSKNRETEPTLRTLLQCVSEEFAGIPLSRPRKEDGQLTPGLVFASLAIDPDACTGCGLCAWICPSEALEPNGTLADTHDQTLAAVRLLPDPNTDAWERIRLASGPITASMTVSTGGRAFAGCPESPGSGPASALRLVLAALEPGPARTRLLDQVQQLQSAMAEQVEREVGRAVAPTEFERMGRELETTGPDALDVRRLAAGLEQANREGRLDSEGLAHRVRIGRQLADLRWRMESATGLGRRSYGLVLGPGLGWAATFPHNPVAAPVWNAENPTFLSVARGLVAAEEERSGREIGWLRAAHELTAETGSRAGSPATNVSTAGSARQDFPATASGLNSIPNAERSEEEWALSPRLVVVVDEAAWTPTRKELAPLLASGGRVWVVLLARISVNGTGSGSTGSGSGSAAGAASGPTGSGPEGSASDLVSPDSAEPPVRTLVAGDAWALQSSPAAPRHLTQALTEMARDDRPAVLRLLVPEAAESPARGVNGSTERVTQTAAAWDQVQSALQSGAFALGLWNPAGARSRIPADARMGEAASAAALGTSKVVTSAEVVALRKQIESLQSELAATGKRVREETESEMVQRLARRLGQVSRQAQAARNGETPQ